MQANGYAPLRSRGTSAHPHLAALANEVVSAGKRHRQATKAFFECAQAAHPEWYPELSSQSSTRQIAQALYMPAPERSEGSGAWRTYTETLIP